METMADFVMWAANGEDSVLRQEALATIHNVVEAVYALYGIPDQEIYDMLPWFAALEEIYVFYFCESNDAPT